MARDLNMRNHFVGTAARSWVLVLLVLICRSAPGAQAVAEQPAKDAAAAAVPAPETDTAVRQEAQAAFAAFLKTMEGVNAYQVTMQRQQRIDGKLQDPDTILIKHRRSPECRYMRWLDGEHKDREVLQCADRHDGKLRLHQPGMLGITLTIDPNGSTFRKSGNLRSPSDSGLFNLAKRLSEDRDQGEAGVDVRASLESIDGEAVVCVSRPGRQRPQDPYPVGRAEICLDRSTHLPARVRMWHVDGQLMEFYRFSDYKLNPGFTDADFSEDNPDYDF